MEPGFSTRGLLLICLAGGGWAFSFGVGSQLGTHWLKDQGANDSIIGLNHAVYYFGLTLGSLLSSRLIRQWNVRWAIFGLVLCALSLALFPRSGGLPGWFVWRLVNGLASSLSLLPLETFVSQGSKEGERSWNFGLFNGCLTVGGAAGIAIGLTLYEPGGMLPFYLGSLSAMSAALTLGLGQASLSSPWTDAARLTSAESLDWKNNFLSFGTAWIQGFLEGGMVAFVALYLERSLGMSEELAGILMGVTLVGVIIVQVPVGWLADRCGRLPVLLAAYAVIIGGLVGCHGADRRSGWACGCALSERPRGLFIPWACRFWETASSRACWCEPIPGTWPWIASAVEVGAAAMGEARALWGENAMFGAGLAAVGLVLGSSLLLSHLRPTASRQDTATEIARKDAA